MGDVLDLRDTGPLTEQDELALAKLIAEACSKDHVKHFLSMQAKQDFGWSNGLLANYVLANLMSDAAKRAKGFLSSSEWLCGVFGSGETLAVEHVRILMMYTQHTRIKRNGVAWRIQERNGSMAPGARCVKTAAGFSWCCSLGQDGHPRAHTGSCAVRCTREP